MTDLAPYFAGVLAALGRSVAKAQSHAPRGSLGSDGRLNGGQFLPKGAWPIDPERPVPVVRLLPPGMGTAAENHGATRAWAREHLGAPKEWKNEATGWKVTVPISGIDEAIHRLLWPYGIARQTLAAVPELIRVAVPVGMEPDEKGREEILAVHTLGLRLESATRFPHWLPSRKSDHQQVF